MSGDLDPYGSLSALGPALAPVTHDAPRTRGIHGCMRMRCWRGRTHVLGHRLIIRYFHADGLVAGHKAPCMRLACRIAPLPTCVHSSASGCMAVHADVQGVSDLLCVKAGEGMPNAGIPVDGQAGAAPTGLDTCARSVPYRGTPLIRGHRDTVQYGSTAALQLPPDGPRTQQRPQQCGHVQHPFS